MGVISGMGLAVSPLWAASSNAVQEKDPVETEQHDEFKDNSFLIEEAYNQEPGEVGYQTNLAISRFAEPFYLHLNAGATLIPGVRRKLPADSFSPRQDLLGFNFGLSAIYRIRPMLNLLFEFVAARDQEISDTGSKEEKISLIFSPGIRYAINLPGNVQHVLGMGLPVALSHETADRGIFFYYSMEHHF